jgi:hypothetical protein
VSRCEQELSRPEKPEQALSMQNVDYYYYYYYYYEVFNNNLIAITPTEHV